MNKGWPRKVLLTGGAHGGGVDSYAQTLACGFRSLGIESEVIAPHKISGRLGELRDPGVLKFLSTTAAFAVLFARRSFVIAHGFPCVRNQGWLRTLAILASYKLANFIHGAQLVVVSGYSALHLESIFNIRVDGVIRNPLHPIFAEPSKYVARRAITFVGRLHRSKNVDKLLPVMQRVLDRHCELGAWIIGEGPERSELEKIYGAHPRIKFWGALPREEVRGKLGDSRIFISGNPTEPFGIVFLEALSQGCAVVMPASGGGLEIAPEELGDSIQLFGVSMNQSEIEAAIERALMVEPAVIDLSSYAAAEVAKKYLQLDARFNPRGVYNAATQIAEVHL
jgi:glycosyltransferase involved in cell wall biosynthesis